MIRDVRGRLLDGIPVLLSCPRPASILLLLDHALILGHAPAGSRKSFAHVATKLRRDCTAPGQPPPPPPWTQLLPPPPWPSPPPSFPILPGAFLPSSPEMETRAATTSSGGGAVTVIRLLVRAGPIRACSRWRKQCLRREECSDKDFVRAFRSDDSPLFVVLCTCTVVRVLVLLFIVICALCCTSSISIHRSPLFSFQK